ncbi:uroporphyrinogen-III synthase [Thiomicrospira sp. R3]|uniref:uroporphyrinogen-III synthase n=1 Tax=Thiomicrospira sp. R3 TaxID=3035472 RepID=UPI00259B1A50|nr:uroporphyrinogen-III synthase [Thiomicrospira sp. R3]WFE69606.1 uroporphyrinogen-III synthase [Thiomicrospira sp. R3]
MLNTRPAHQAKRLTDLFQQAGYCVIECPALQIETQLLPKSPNWHQQDVWVFVSRNAVLHFAKQLASEQSQTAKLVAVGAATAEAIALQGWQNTQPLPSRYDSEGMLALAVFKQPKGLKVGVVRGDGGRAVLAETLKQQGADVAFYEVYRRVAAPFCHQAWSRFKQMPYPVLFFSSNASLDAFVKQRSANNQAWYRAQPFITFSQRIADYARQQGFVGRALVTANSTDQAVLDSFTLLLNSQGE